MKNLRIAASSAFGFACHQVAVRVAHRRLRKSAVDVARLQEALKRTEEALRRNVAALRAARAAAREGEQTRHRFLANMSHELRTPLNSILGFASYLLSDPSAGLPPSAHDVLQRIHGSGTSLLRLVEMLLDLSKIEAGWVLLQASHVDVLPLARSTAEEVKGHVGGRPVEVLVEGEEGLDPIETDAGKLKQIFLNLLGNAIKYTPSGSVIVRIARDPSSRRPGHVDVIDTGPGVAAELRPSIEEVLGTGGGVTHRGGRTCLGLGIAAALGRKIGARIVLQPDAGVGAAFRVFLPMGIPSGAKTMPVGKSACPEPGRESEREIAPSTSDIHPCSEAE